MVAGRRAVSLGRSTPRAFHAFVTTPNNQSAAKKTEGGTVYQNYPSWYGRGLVRLLASAATTDHPSGSDALNLLGLTYDVARNLAEKTAGRTTKGKELPRMKPVPLVEIHDGWRTQRR
jgi:hypothetical protein